MKLVNNSVTYYQQEPGIDGMYKAIQKAAWVCYQTEKSKLSPREFTEKILLPKGHSRPLEFGTVYLTIPFNFTDQHRELTARLTAFFNNNKFSMCATDGQYLYVTTNFRVIMEGFSKDAETAILTGYKDNLIDDMNIFWTEPTPHHPKRHMLFITATRGICDEFKTHTTISSLMESTRLCNYAAGKFGGELTFIRPTGASADKKIKAYERDEKDYLDMLADGLLPQDARDVLPLGVKAEIVMCGFETDWDNLFFRRISTEAHPVIGEISTICKLLIQNTNQRKNPYGVDPSVFIV